MKTLIRLLPMLLMLPAIMQGQALPQKTGAPPGAVYKVNKYGRTPNVAPKPVPIPARYRSAQRAAAAPGDTNWQAPIMVTKGGVITGYFKSTDNTPVIQINTTERVVIRDCYIDAAGDVSIQGYGGYNVVIEHNKIVGHPVAGAQYAKINLWGGRSVRIENNDLEHTGGILVEKWQGTVDSPLIIRYNSGLNTDKRRGDGTPGSHRAFIQLSTIFGLKNCEIAWNQSVNLPGYSYIEDNFNFYNVSGDAAYPIRVHDNYIQGAHPYPANAPNYTGSGKTYDGTPDNNTAATMTGYFEDYNNTVVDCQNALTNIAAGHDIHINNNRLICASQLPDGSSAPGYWAGMCIWDASNVGAALFKGNWIKGSVVGYARQNFNVPFANRQDYVVVANSPISVQPGDNTHLPNPITKAMETAETATWSAKVATAGIAIGNKANPGAGTGGGTGGGVVVVPGVGAQVQVGQWLNGRLKALDSTGKEVTFKAGSVKITSTGGVRIVTNAADEKGYTVNAFAAGPAIVTITLVTNNGKTISKTDAITVTALPEEAVSISTTYTPVL